MPSELRSKIMIDLFAAPAAVIPIAIGFTMATIGWAIGTSGLIAWGFGWGIVGLGIGATRFVLYKDKIIDNAKDVVNSSKEKEKTKELDELDYALARDKDPRTQAVLRDLRALYKSFCLQINTSIIKADGSTIESVETLFDECVSHLKETLVLHSTIRSMSSAAKKPIEAAREKLIVDVQGTVSRLSTIIDGLRQLGVDSNTEELERAAAELEQGLEVSKKVDSALRNAGKGSDYSWLKAKMSEK